MERQAFTISRATWWRGHTAEGSRLLITHDAFPEAKGKMCCLGSIALQCGATKDQIADVTSPGKLRRRGASPAAFDVLCDSYGCAGNASVATRMMNVNDNKDITEAERETKLTTLAATIGWDLTFTD